MGNDVNVLPLRRNDRSGGDGLVTGLAARARKPTAWSSHLSSHHDGTPGTAVLVVVRNLDALPAELHQRGYPFFNPRISPGPGNGRQMQLIDPASNRIRFYESAQAS